ncbi:class 5 chitinase 1 [Grosmannia clavigera kw1407]|uniref:chitinase n=1 Tax=Grosmannia clavigera (strain kw1407 / UAMH 11150) TaxID=655863 RepID=F0XAQ2_GROCL|nr:class 5 chitinase 1 [Grosmannia clavigera kw1407]EFX05996.1 class 5 chitinase 1 [Grosmannia clavigera kw1407]
MAVLRSLFLLQGIFTGIFAASFVQQATEDASTSDYTCTATRGCDIGCCGPLNATGGGVCGAGPDYCGDKCTSQCSWKSECDPGWGLQWSNASTCPLNVCCSKYGFCGTTSDFCGSAVVSSPQCSGNKVLTAGRLATTRAGTASVHVAVTMSASQIPLGYYTHINFAFALIDPTTFHVVAMDSDTASHYDAVTALKAEQPGLEVWIAVGGWAMNDPGAYRTAFSDVAKSETNQDAFFESLIMFMLTHGFDGVDIDWEYPVADDRGGTEADFDNYVNMLKRLRTRMNGSGHQFGLSITLPSSYWYLRGFDIVNLEPYVDWFNMMTYDIHGVWDSTVQSIGSFAYAHTNLTEISTGLELLWRNNINPERVNMGLGFYGRSFTMADPSCMTAGCPFTSGANGGECTGTPGVLSAAEIVKIIAAGATVTFDPVAAVKIVTWDTNQWVSWDDAETLKLKQNFANERCLGGYVVLFEGRPRIRNKLTRQNDGVGD